MATHSTILAWEIPRTEEPGGLQSMRLQKSDMTEQLNNNNIPTFDASDSDPVTVSNWGVPGVRALSQPLAQPADHRHLLKTRCLHCLGLLLTWLII